MQYFNVVWIAASSVGLLINAVFWLVLLNFIYRKESSEERFFTTAFLLVISSIFWILMMLAPVNNFYQFTN